MFLIPDPVINQFTFISAFAWLLSALGFLCTVSLYPAIKASKKKIVDVIGFKG
jgi:ABC-type lipoprotein release transport system permease subunit